MSIDESVGPEPDDRQACDSHVLALKVRDAIAELLRVRAGEMLTDDVIRERANNGAVVLTELFCIQGERA